MSAMLRSVGLACDTWPIRVLFLSSPNIGYGWDDIRRHAEAADAVVSSHLVRDEPEKRGQCREHPADIGAWQLPNRMDMVA